MGRFKLKIRAAKYIDERWIVITANSERQAMRKAQEHCSFYAGLFYALEQTMQPITEEEYDRFIR